MGIEGFGTVSTWLCIYDCNFTCPAKEENFVVEIQWHINVFSFGCDSRIPNRKSLP